MSKRIRINGKAKFQNIDMGFWGIVASDGKKYRPINMPEQLKVEGADVQCVVEAVDYDVDIYMWGTAVEVVSFVTPSP